MNNNINKPYRICYVATIGATIKAFFISQLKYLSQNGFDVTVICSPEDDLEELLGKEIHYYPVTIPRGISFIKMFKSTKQIREIIKSERFDIVQYSTPNAALCSSYAAAKESVPIRNYHLMGLRYLSEKGIKKTILKSLEKFTCNLSTNIECVSKSNLDLAIKESLFTKEKGCVIFNGSTGGIDINRFSISDRTKYREDIRKKYKIDSSDFVFGFVGRITRDKGINELLSAFNKLENNAKLLLVGYLDEANTLDQTLYKDSLSDANIIYTGPVKDVEAYFSALDCLVLPSYREGFGNVVIEAAAMGTPSIVSNIPGPIDATIENVTSIWINPKDVSSLYNAMKHMMTIDYKKMGLQASEYAREYFDENILNEHILERKKELLNNI